jgi:hypothetical protein
MSDIDSTGLLSWDTSVTPCTRLPVSTATFTISDLQYPQCSQYP